MAKVTLTVCTTCRKTVDGERIAADPRPGATLIEMIEREGLPDGVELRGAECLSACSRGCSIVVSGGEKKWTYIYGDMDPEPDHVEQILSGVSSYCETDDGLVPWRERPTVFRKNVIARIPPISPDAKEKQNG